MFHQDDTALIDHIPLVGGRDPASVRRRVLFIERLLEGLIVIPGTRRRIGLDVLLDLFSWLPGDIIANAIGAYMIWEARNIGMSRLAILRMTMHVGINALIGIIPFAGGVATIFYRSNTYNLRMIIRHLDKYHPASAVIDNKSV
ncbi:MAG: DUF4112 domain-containing protein [Alphaproteobacteria bacterium]|nr:DUF4112 domain-containing protein [Alphaproteobacteria bacterium]MDE2340824.1 DUF4112 domain-containing protein [Alphaproteobacteria bacterium]